MNANPKIAAGFRGMMLWLALALLASSLLIAQEQENPEQVNPEQVNSEQASPEQVQDEQTVGGQQQPGQAPAVEDRAESAANAEVTAQPEATEQEATPAEATETEPDVPVQSLTGPLELLINPVYPPERARRVYQPLVDYLNETTGLELTLVVDLNFHRYWRNARRNEAPPLILEDAHMVAWRMLNFDYQPLVTTEAPVTFSLLTTGDLADDSLVDFVGRRISSLPSPSLGYLVLADWYSNPMQQPLIESTATSWLDAVEMLFSGETDAVIAPNNLAARYPNLYPVETSPEFPGLTLSASPDVPDDVRQALIDAMTVLHEDDEHHSALFELDIDSFVVADPAAYRGLEQRLSTVFSL